MLAANVWHWWIGVILTLLIVGVVIGLVVVYLKSVTAQKYEPGASKRHRQSSDL